jgi:predicted amidohydrolase
MRVALAQYALGADLDRNLAKALELMQGAAQLGAELLVFPELCVSPFFPQFAGQDVTRYVMKIDDAYVRTFRDACRKLTLVASPNVYLEESGRRFDASLMLDADGELLGVSKMVHVAQVPGFYEQDYYMPSDTGFIVHETKIGKIGVVVCFDRHYPESIRTCVLRGAQIIIIPTANTMAEPRDIFECELRAAAIQNGVFIAMCNRVGEEFDVTFCGESTIVGPRGDVIKKAACDEEIVIADVDLGDAHAARRERPYLSLRRPELYE